MVINYVTNSWPTKKQYFANRDSEKHKLLKKIRYQYASNLLIKKSEVKIMITVTSKFQFGRIRVFWTSKGFSIFFWLIQN